MFAFGGLPGNLASFCALLRREYGFHIGAGELVDAARALDVVDIASERAVRHGLRTILSGSRADAAAFDQAFDRFFFPRPSRPPHESEALVRELGTDTSGVDVTLEDAGSSEARTRDVPELENRPSLDVGSRAVAIEEEAGEPSSAISRATYSPLASDASEAPELPDVDAAWIETARALVRHVQLGLSRRWRPALKGRRFDLRRTLRSSLQTGGETLAPRWLGRRRHTPRIIFLIDGSRSMSEHARTALQMAVAIARVTSRIEVFTFSTGLSRVTTELRGAVAAKIHRLPRLASAWGGGTCIGASLADFLRRFGEALVSRNTVVMVASDGLDVGEPETLRVVMQQIHRRAAAVVWLNPLADTPGYEPTAVGMTVARPFVTTFLAVTDLPGFVRLSRAVRLRG
jgi:uncharacterized protein